MYDTTWHVAHGAKTTASAEIVIDIVRSIFPMDDVFDMGCGDGRWLSVCKARGATTILGVDGPWTNKRQLLIPEDAFVVADVSKPLDLERRFSLAMSLEVAEHIAGEASEVFVDNLVRHSDVVLFGAAIPYQGGYRHINERWQSYWAGLFASRGYEPFDPLRSQIWNDENVHFWYKQNALIYVRRTSRTAMSLISDYIHRNGVNQLPLDIVHPEKYQTIASYKQVAFRALMKELPFQAARKLATALLGRT